MKGLDFDYRASIIENVFDITDEALLKRIHDYTSELWKRRRRAPVDTRQKYVGMIVSLMLNIKSQDCLQRIYFLAQRLWKKEASGHPQP